MLNRRQLAAALALLVSCAEDDPLEGEPKDDPQPAGCPRQLAAADRDRFVVVSQPFGATAGTKQHRYEVLRLTTAGALEATGHVFEMRTTMYGDILFTPDGEIGIAAQDDNQLDLPGGTLGVFRLAEDGTPQIIDSAFDVGGYISYLAMAPSGDRVYAVDVSTRNNGGGVYAARIECDGTLVSEGLILGTDNASQLALLDGGRQVLVARGIYDAADQLVSAPGDTIHLLQDFTTVLDGDQPFLGPDVTAWSIAVTPDGRYALAGDVNYVSSTPAVGVVRIGPSALTTVQTLGAGFADFDPVGIHFSPFGNGGLVVSGFGNDVYRLAYDTNAQSTPFELVGALTYTGGAPLLPGRSVMVARGGLAGLVLFIESEGARRVRMSTSGAADQGVSAVAMQASAIGVQP